MSERHMMASRREPSDQIDAAFELGGDGDDANIRRCAFDFVEDVGGGELFLHVGRVLWTRHDRRVRRTPPTYESAAVQRCARAAQTFNRLRAAEFRIDEVALEMRRQNAGRARIGL